MPSQCPAQLMLTMPSQYPANVQPMARPSQCPGLANAQPMSNPASAHHAQLMSSQMFSQYPANVQPIPSQCSANVQPMPGQCSPCSANAHLAQPTSSQPPPPPMPIQCSVNAQPIIPSECSATGIFQLGVTRIHACVHFW